ncbi:MAG: fumarylacetoacetate hydrolase family protein [Paludibacteraceae bacterium]|nr:fumarylacetoacetate hydrolase family protein [Paludibacteraceae bacterium]
MNQKKPFFIPDWSTDIQMVRCQVVRICRLGKCIQSKFAYRYYDAIAPGVDFRARDYMESNWAQATAFDNSLCVGEWETPSGEANSSIDDAIAQVSRIVTLRNGDLIFIDEPSESQPIEKEMTIEDKNLYCKIK